MSLSFKFLSTSVVTLCKSVEKYVNSGNQTRVDVGQLNWYIVYPRWAGYLVGESVRFIGGRISYRWYPFITEFFSGMEGFLKEYTIC